jgi:hypothetical protein
MPAQLIERTTGRSAIVHLLTEGVTTIGRGAECEIVIAADHVSRRHAQVSCDGEEYTLHDLGSKNGTFLNGARLAQPQSLHDGDLIALAGRTDPALVFEVAAETITVYPEAAGDEGIRIDPRTAEVWLRGRLLQLTAKEYQALALLHRADGGLVTKQALATGVWPEIEGMVSDDSIEQLIARLRRKIEETPERPRSLVTVRGLGYRLMK